MRIFQYHEIVATTLDELYMFDKLRFRRQPRICQSAAFPTFSQSTRHGYLSGNSSISYDIYLPPACSTNGTPLPILYTLNPSGGGMVSSFQTVCSNMNIIAVGITGSANGVPWDKVLREYYAVTRDVRQRVLFDPTAELVGGFSGGGENSYVFSRFRAQHVAGIFAMAGWLARYYTYYTIDRVQTNLFVARATGNSDSAALYYLAPDSNYLASCGAIIQDWSFSGGHAIAPDMVKSNCLVWLLSQRIPAEPNDQSNALAQATNWVARIAAGSQEAVLRECVNTLMNQPRSWYAYQAQLILDQLMTNYTAFRLLNVSNLAQGDFTSDLFYYYAHGAATNNDRQRYYASLKALTGVIGVNGDRAGDIYTLLQKFGYPAPLLQTSADSNAGQINVWVCKDTPGLAYSVQSRSNLVNDVWQNASITAVDTNTIWSAGFGLPPGVTSGFYRVGTTPSPATSPPWPPP